MRKPVVLCILDGCGIREEKDGNAFFNANKPNFDYLWENYPHSLLEASGSFVGLPDGQMGNSEVGHMNIGAGRIVYQPLELINESIKNKTFFENEEIINIINHVVKNDSKLHIMGLLSDGGVHSHINHLLALIDMLKEHNIKKVCYHLFLDGRDVAPKSAHKYIKILEKKIKETKVGKIVSLHGRYYAMDRDNNYDRLKKSYDAIMYGEAPRFLNAYDIINESYNNGITDEFVVPSIINDGIVKDNDGVITFNFRPDRLKQLFTCFTNTLESKIKCKKIDNLKVLTMMPVTKEVMCPYAFSNQNLTNTLGEVLYNNDLNQLRIAETEKYAHVTYFCDGGKEKEYLGMNKILIPSPKVTTYDLKPEMSAEKITDTLIKELDKDIYDVIILNYANGDMVGHTGNYDASVKAVEYVDKCIGKLYNKLLEKEGTLIITADHGNCDIMWDENKNIVTSHTTSKVPLIITSKTIELEDGVLADIAPTILEFINIKKPNEMTGKSLIKK